MDLATISAAVLLALGLLGVDAVINSNSVIVEVTTPPKMERFNIDQSTIEEEFDTELFAIARTPSVVVPLEIRANTDQGLGMALAKEARLQDVAYALQSELGFQPDRIRLSMFTEDGQVRGIVSVRSKRAGDSRQVFTLQKDESLLHFVNHSAIWAASQIAPYITALHLLEQHSKDSDFSDVIALSEATKAKLPQAPVNVDRSAFDNLLGIVQLFKNDPTAANAQFIKAMAEDPNSAPPVLNTAFAEIQLDQDADAAKRMEHLIATAPPSNHILLATAYTTWGAAEIGTKHLPHADQLLRRALEIDPNSSTAFELLSDVRSLQGDQVGAAEAHLKALQSQETFENYGEVATLYFQLAWKDGQPVKRSEFTNPTIVTFH